MINELKNIGSEKYKSEAAMQEEAEKKELTEQTSISKTSFKGKRGGALPEYLYWYFNKLVQEYSVLTSNDNPELHEKAKKIIEKISDLTWDDLFILERIILLLQPDEAVRKRVWVVREECRKILGEQFYKNYKDTNPLDPSNADIKALRADLNVLISQLHQYYLSLEAREESLSTVKTSLVRSAGAIMFVIFLFLVMYNVNIPDDVFIKGIKDVVDKSRLFFAVISSGVVGAFVSVLRRVQAIPSTNTHTDDSVTIQLNLHYSFGSIMAALFFGAVFSVVLFFLFAGHFIEGEVFPKFNEVNASGFDFCAFISQIDPKGGVNFGKLMIWSFLAGFAENFVPDSLDRIRAKATNNKSVGKN